MSEARAARNPPSFSPIAVLWMVLASMFSFSAYVVLSAYAPDLRGGSDGGGHALSRSAIGFAGLVRLMQTQGEPVVLSRKPVGAQDGLGLLILTPSPANSADQVFDASARGDALIVLPKWNAINDPDNPAWVDQAGLVDVTALSRLLSRRVPGVALTRRADTAPVRLIDSPTPSVILKPTLIAGQVLTTGPIEQLQTLRQAPGMVPILSDDRGGVVLAVTPDAHTVLLSDPDLLNTHGLRDLATARTALAMVHGLSDDTPTVFDLTLNGFDSPRSLLKLAFAPPFLGATLCLVAAAGLMGFHAASRFGAPRRTPRAVAFGKRALADNSAALIRLARREPRMAGRYLDLNRTLVARALGATRLSGADLDAFLDRLAEKNGLAFRLSTLGAEAAAAKTRADLMRVARDLHQWRLEMTRECR